MLSYAGLDKEFWAEAVSYAGHLINRLPTAANEGAHGLENLLLIITTYIYFGVLLIFMSGKASLIQEPRKLFSWDLMMV
jgi:hypothetical protein